MVAISLLLAWLLYPKPRLEARDAGKIEITYWTVPAFIEDIKPAVEEFERRNPEYRVLIGTASVRDLAGDPTRFLLGVAGEVPPDVIFFDRFAIVEWASRGAFADLTPFIDQTKNDPDAIREENFFAAPWKESIYKGRNYAIATEADSRAMFFRKDPLIRAGFVYTDSDEGVKTGQKRAGDPRPPQTWEDLCRKLVHAEGNATSDGTVTLTGFPSRPAVNEDVPHGKQVDLAGACVRAGDVAVLVRGSNVFRARIVEVTGENRFRFDFSRELPPGTRSVPSTVTGDCEIKIFSQDTYISKLTRFDPATGGLAEVAFIPFYGDSWLYLYGWSNGAEFMSEDGTRVTLDSREIVEALQWVTDVYDSLGGIDKARGFQYGATGANIDPLLTEKIVMRIDTNPFLQSILKLRPDLKFGVVRAPIPEKRLAAGFKPVGWGGGFAHAIPATSRNKEAAWKLVRWLSSLEGNQVAAEAQASYMRARGQAFFPRLHSDKRVVEWMRDKYVMNNPRVSQDFVDAYNVYMDLMPASRYRPVTPVGQMLWSEHVRATETAINHAKPPYEALNYGTRRVQGALDRVLSPPTGPLVPWRLLLGIYIASVALIIAGFIIHQYRWIRHYGGATRWIEGYVSVFPWLLGFLVFGAGPIFFSLVISFCHYDVLSPARYVGLENYGALLGRHFDPVVNAVVWNDPLFWKSLSNTAYMIIGVPLSIILGLAIAMLLDLNVRGLKAYRTVYYLPSIVPAVASFILWFWIFDPSRGLLNNMLRSVGVADPPTWLLDPNWAKPSLILMGLWGVGASMIIWLAGLKDIPESFYEAAAVDGATAMQRFRHVTLPLLSPYILFNTIMGLIGVFQIFEASYIMTDGGPADATFFFAYKLFNEAFRYLNMGPASAMAWILFVLVLSITLLQLWLSKKWVHYGW